MRVLNLNMVALRISDQRIFLRNAQDIRTRMADFIYIFFIAQRKENERSFHVVDQINPRH